MDCGTLFGASATRGAGSGAGGAGGYSASGAFQSLERLFQLLLHCRSGHVSGHADQNAPRTEGLRVKVDHVLTGQRINRLFGRRARAGMIISPQELDVFAQRNLDRVVVLAADFLLEEILLDRELLFIEARGAQNVGEHRQRFVEVLRETGQSHAALLDSDVGGNVGSEKIQGLVDLVGSARPRSPAAQDSSRQIGDAAFPIGFPDGAGAHDGAHRDERQAIALQHVHLDAVLELELFGMPRRKRERGAFCFASSTELARAPASDAKPARHSAHVSNAAFLDASASSRAWRHLERVVGHRSVES